MVWIVGTAEAVAAVAAHVITHTHAHRATLESAGARPISRVE